VRLRNQTFGKIAVTASTTKGVVDRNDKGQHAAPCRAKSSGDGPNGVPVRHSTAFLGSRCDAGNVNVIVAVATIWVCFYDVARSFSTGPSADARSAFCADVASTKRNESVPHMQLMSVQSTGEFRWSSDLQSLQVMQSRSSL
jgi:hypothetical protein